MHNFNIEQCISTMKVKSWTCHFIYG